MEHRWESTLEMLAGTGGFKFTGFTFIGSMLAGSFAAQQDDGSVQAIFVSAFDNTKVLAYGSEDKTKTNVLQVVFLTYDNQRPSPKDVSLPANLAALCPSSS